MSAWQLLDAVVERFATVGVSTMKIAVLKANGSARQFYEAMCGELAGEQDFDEGGELLPEVVYRLSPPRAMPDNLRAESVAPSD